MLFTQIEFLVLLGGCLVALRALPRESQRKAFLLFASYYFYAWWDWRFCGLVAASTLVDFVVAAQMARSDSSVTRRRLLIVSVVFNLGLLVTFKYMGFFTESLAVLLAPLGLEVGTLRFLLPIGISFYTFQTLSYTIDVYRGSLEPTDSLLDFALFVAFFPQLVAGPIVRAADLLPQLATPRERSREDLLEGSRRFVIGLFKKVFIADNLAPFVDEVFAHASVYDSATVWLAALAFTVQIYCDFAGYSDMAIGVARCLGYRFDENFNFPYLARSLSEFWTRWHISLSSWLRDYLYISLGGNRKGSSRTAANLLITMLLGGLWHGAAWTFVVWGGFHGLALVAQRRLEPLASAMRRLVGHLPTEMAKWACCQVVVIVGWVLFRAPDFWTAWAMVKAMALPTQGLHWSFPLAWVAVILVSLVHLAKALAWDQLVELPARAWYTPALIFTMLGMALLYHPASFNPFLYFQF